MTSHSGEQHAQTAASGTPPSLAAGRVGRPHGLDGSFYVTRPRPRLLREGMTVSVADRALAIVRRAGTERHPIVRLAGVEDRAGAQALRGMDLMVAGEQAPALGEGEWWAHELEGCTVVDGEALLGTVSRLIELPSCEALEVRPTTGGEPVLVPMVKEAVRRVNPQQERIEVNLDFLGLARHASGAGTPGERERAARGREPEHDT